MSVEKKIEHTLSDNFDLSHLEVINESHKDLIDKEIRYFLSR